MAAAPTVSVLRAAVYTRYSSEAQSAASIEDQVRECRERIVREGWVEVEVYSDAAQSGASARRPGYQALLTDARSGCFDVVVAESLDRLSRDQEDIAALLKRLRFHGIGLLTVSEGEIGELHVGLKGTMNALFLRDLAEKTRRGLRGRVESGRSGGGRSYAYDLRREVDACGEPVRGGRVIVPGEADVVRRIFRAYAGGRSPKSIALELNRGGVPGPRGGAWSASTINGNRARGTGILNNELYAGRLVWNRLGYVKDPETGRRRSRPKSAAELIHADVPELRIVEEELWQAARDRQQALEHGGTSEKARPGHAAFWSKQRPRYLFSGLMRCGVCGGGFSKISAAHFGCSGARNKGETVCGNRLTIRRDRLERTVLDGLRVRLMDPTVYEVFAGAFVAEWNRLAGSRAAVRTELQAERVRIDRQIGRLVDAIADGTPPALVRDRLIILEKRRCTLDADLAEPIDDVPRLPPSLPTVYRAQVETLQDALDGDDGSNAREMLRNLIETVVLHPEPGGLRVEVRGDLSAILRLGTGPAGRNLEEAERQAMQIKLVAGTGFEPVTFRL